MPAILIYVLGVLTLPFLCLAYCLLVDLFHRSAWYCPWCSEWAVKSKDNPNRTAYLPNIIVWFARIVHRLSKRHRKWKRVYETYDFHPCKPSNVLRDGHMDEVIPLDDFDYGYQTIRYKSHRKGLDGKELIVTVEVPSETPYITCIRDGEQTEGDVYRNPDGSLGRTIRAANGSHYSTRMETPTRLLVRKKRKQTLDGKHLGRRNRTRKKNNLLKS